MKFMVLTFLSIFVWSIMVIKKIDEAYGMKLHILKDLIDGYHIITHHYIAKLRYN